MSSPSLLCVSIVPDWAMFIWASPLTGMGKPSSGRSHKPSTRDKPTPWGEASGRMQREFCEPTAPSNSKQFHGLAAGLHWDSWSHGVSHREHIALFHGGRNSWGRLWKGQLHSPATSHPQRMWGKLLRGNSFSHHGASARGNRRLTKRLQSVHGRG